MTEFGRVLKQMKAEFLDELKSEVNYRDAQIDLLFNLLMKTDQFLYPNMHAYGLSGTGKTFTIRSFMQKFADFKRQAMMNRTILQNYKAVPNYYFVYFDCAEICHVSISVLFYEVLVQIRNILVNEKAFTAGELDDLDNYQSACDDNEEIAEVGVGADYSNFVRQLKKYVRMLAEINKPSNVNILIVFDNADNFKFISDASNLILTIFKLNEYVNCSDYSTSVGGSRQRVRLTNLFVSEIDWHSILSDCELMSRTEAPRPFIIFFDEYSKDQMCVILKKTANYLVSMNAKSAYYQAELRSIKKSLEIKNANANVNADEANAEVTMYQQMEYLNNVEFYAQIILEVFFPICKDLNEIQYLIQIYYDQIMSSIKSAMNTPSQEDEGKMTNDAYKKMMKVWKTMQPFLRQALTQIYLRQSTFQFSSSLKGSSEKPDDDGLSKEFEGLNLEKSGELGSSAVAAAGSSSFNQLPKVMRILLISAYICTHNPPKYDKKLFEYNSTVKSRKTKHTATKHQQNEEQQRSAALKMQTFDMNRLLAIFVAICAENSFDQVLNLSLIQMSIQTLKSLNYLQQTNSSYSLDESKFKCLLDLASIERISASVQFNIKQHLAEFISV